MIVNTDTKIIYLGDGTTTAFPIPFKFADPSHIKLSMYDIDKERETPVETGYFVDEAASILYYPGYPSGQEPGEAMRPPVAPVGTKLIIYRQTPINQLVDMGEKYPLPIIEAMEDKLTFISQEMKEQLDRSVKVDRGSDYSAEEFIEWYLSAIDSAADAAKAAADSANAFASNAGEYADRAESSKNVAVEAKDIAVEKASETQRIIDGGLVWVDVFSVVDGKVCMTFEEGR